MQLSTRKPLAIGFALILTATMVQPVAASGGRYGWSSCNWETNNPDGAITVRAGGYPGDSWGDGVKNSFNDRINSAVAAWDDAFSRAGYIIPWGVYRVADSSSSYDVLVEQYEFGSGSSLWGSVATYSNLGWESCTMHSTYNEFIIWARVRTDVHAGWFTQDDSRRALWENCPSNSYEPSYTCSKNRDFESLLMHELGHAFGLPHPQSVDAHQPSLDPDAAHTASCQTTLDRATMCATLLQYRSSGRTLHTWDRESLRVLETKH